jgi:murein L,D-transpeptidase YafK
VQRFTDSVDEMGSRLVLGQRPMETDLLVKQARTFFHQGLYSRSIEAVEAASELIHSQAATLAAELGRYADEASVAVWRRMAQRTVEWSRRHGEAAIVVSKADRRLTLYRSGRPVVSYPVRLGFNGMMEKRFQGDGATPEGQYRVIRKRDRGQTRFYRALLLDYPNAEDRRRFRVARHRGTIPAEANIGGEIEIHGGDDAMLSQTLGCVMLDNRQIDVVFNQTETGTPVTIVGALKVTNAVSVALAGLHHETDAADVEEDEEGLTSRKLVSVTDTES